MESGRWGNRDGGEKSGEIRDERALHILLYLSKQLASQPKVSSSLSLSLSFFLSPPLCQTDDRMWREGLERRDSWRWKDNGFWNAIALLTFGDFGVLCWCVCLWNPSHSRISYGHSTRPHWLSLKHSSEFRPRSCRLMIHITDPAGPRARDMRIFKHYANSKNDNNINLLGGKHTCCILLCRITELLRAIDRYVLLYPHSVQ